MNYQSETIASAVEKLNSVYFLPTLQREFVWDSKRICRLFDSLMRGYPIGSFLLWWVPVDSRRDLEIYQFINAVSEHGKHNDRTHADFVADLAFVLDGQQRLTSMLVGLKGTYEAKIKYARGKKSTAQYLFLDILKDGDEADGMAEPTYGFSFRDSGTSSDRKSYWFYVGCILHAVTELQRDELVQKTVESVKTYRSGTPEQLALVAKNINRLHAVVHTEQAILHHTEKHADQKRMLEIFVRANSGGKPLSKPDLLLSNLTVHWKDRNAREEVKTFVDELNATLNLGCRGGKKILQQDFVLKACLVLLNKTVAYNLLSFNKGTCGDILEEWDNIKSSIDETVRVCNWFGLNGQTLTSTNALIPVAYFIYKNEGLVNLRGTQPADARNAAMVRRWLIMSLLNGVFGGTSDSMLHQLREVLKRHGVRGSEFPIRELDAAITQAKRLPSSGPRAIERLFSIQYKDPRCFLALTLLFNDIGWGADPHEMDHIFPQETFKSALKRHKDQRDCLGNLTLLNRMDNREKSSKPFEEWITTRSAEFRKRHLIPEQPELWAAEAFPAFIEERNRLIQERLRLTLSES